MNATGYYTHPLFRKHDMGAGHPECPQRLAAIEDRLLVTGVLDALDHREPTPASLAEIELAHGRMHIAAMRGLSDFLKEDLAAGGPTHYHVDADTALNEFSYQAALMSAGAAISATDAVIAGELENAFCAVRPPGHHACRDKAMGFCLFNNVAVGALHARAAHGLRRVAVVDFDVHHGNGNAELLAGDPGAFTFSMHGARNYPLQRPPSTLDVELPDRTGDEGYLAALDRHLAGCFERAQPQLAFYLAGVDVVEGDRFGRLALARRGLAARDRRVLEEASRRGVPLVLVLAGGYARTPEETADLHAEVHRQARALGLG